MQPKPLAIYIHWPFCKSKCPYCDFNSHVRDSVEQARWKGALLRELDYMAAHVANRQVASIFFGGGTPSLMPPETVAALIERVHALFPVSDNIEITLEANPTSVEAERFRQFKSAGINRLSLGVQSLVPEELVFLGRGHSVGEALAAVELARSLFDRYSFDLIYARPRQTLESWEKELTEALRYVGDHLSLYQLTIEENTAFHHAYAKGGFTLPDEAQAEALYRLTETLLAERGLLAYEVSNYARPGQESRHNLAYWQGHDYIGVGPGAHGRITVPLSADSASLEPRPMREPMRVAHNRLPAADRGIGSQREHIRIATQTIKSPERWLEQVERTAHASEIWQEIEPQREAEERLMMGLRLREGIAYDAFIKQTGFDLRDYLNRRKLALFTGQGLLEENTHHLRTTLNGRLVLGTLTAELLA